MDRGKLVEPGYGIIIIMDLIQALNIATDFEYQVIRWDDVNIPMDRTKLNKVREKIYKMFSY